MILLHLDFLCYYCSINLRKQSEHSGLRLDTSSLVCIIKTRKVQKRIKINFFLPVSKQTFGIIGSLIVSLSHSLTCDLPFFEKVFVRNLNNECGNKVIWLFFPPRFGTEIDRFRVAGRLTTLEFI